MSPTQGELCQSTAKEHGWKRSEWFGLFGDAVIVPAPRFAARQADEEERSAFYAAAAALEAVPADKAELR